MNYKLTKAQYALLLEALRRYQRLKFPNKTGLWRVSDMQSEWTGLGFPSEYKPVVKAGLMTTVHGRETPRNLNWYQLTKKGAEIVLMWHEMGFYFDDNENVRQNLVASPPMEFNNV